MPTRSRIDMVGYYLRLSKSAVSIVIKNGKSGDWMAGVLGSVHSTNISS